MAGEFLGALTGGAIGSAVVRLVLDSDQYNAELARAKGQAATATTGMASSFNKFKAVGVAALGAASVALTRFIGDAVQSAIEAEQVLAKLKTAVGENTAAYEAQALALQEVTGFQDELILSADTVLSRFKLTSDQIQQAIPIVLDYARATGKDVPAAAGAIGKALLGNTRALKEVGIQFTATGKTGADFADILGLLEDKVGGTAEAFGKTAAGQLAIAQARFDEVKESIGAELLPVLTELLESFTAVTDALAPILTEALGGVVDAIDPILDSLTALTDLLQSVGLASEDAADKTSFLGDVFTLAFGGPVAFAERQGEKTLEVVKELGAESQAAALKTIDLGQAIDWGKRAAQRFVPFIYDLAVGEQSAADKTREFTAALQAQREEMRLLVGGQIGLVQAQVDVKEAQQAYNEAVKDSGPKSREAKDAALELVSADIELTSQIKEQKQALRDADVALGGVVAQFDQWATRLGVTKTTLAALNDELRAFNALVSVGATAPSPGFGNGGRAPAGFDIDQALRTAASRGAA